MQLSDILAEKNVFADLKAGSKRDLLQELADKAAKALDIDSRVIFDALLERESLGSTGFGEGTAFPHARIPDVKKVKAFFAKTDQPIDFESADGKPVDLVFMLISPENSGADHLTALATISRVLKDEQRCAKLRECTRRDKMFAILKS